MKSTVLLSVLATLASAAVFSSTTFNDISIAGGTAGNAREEALAALSGLPADLTQVEQADLDFLSGVNAAANDAEVGAFNPAVAAATGPEADALQRGKIKNKVLKLTATMLRLQAEQAQGQNVAAEMTKEQQKLDKNIAQDEAEAGNPSTAVPFDGNIAA